MLESREISFKQWTQEEVFAIKNIDIIDMYPGYRPANAKRGWVPSAKLGLGSFLYSILKGTPSWEEQKTI